VTKPGKSGLFFMSVFSLSKLSLSLKPDPKPTDTNSLLSADTKGSAVGRQGHSGNSQSTFT